MRAFPLWVVLFFSVIVASQDYSNWTVRTGWASSSGNGPCGYINGSIYILGGWGGSGATGINTQMVKYNIASDTITIFSGYLDTALYDHNKASSQIGDKIYGINDNAPNELYVFDLNTLSFEDSIARDGLDGRQCLAYSDRANMLYVQGASSSSDVVLGFNLNSSIWETVPSLNTARYRAMCIVDEVHYRLWIIGGSSVDAVERISTPISMNETWDVMPSISTATWLGEAVNHNELILIMAGNGYEDTIYGIDVHSGNISQVGTLGFVVYGAYSIGIVEDSIFLFGGWTRSGWQNQWQYLRISPSPTLEPTLSPTSYPTTLTSGPSGFPTKSPSNEPTVQPTDFPTMAPSVQTAEPSLSPTLDPTHLPTLSPTDSTMTPSATPTETSSAIPTDSPSFSPSNVPIASTTSYQKAVTEHQIKIHLWVIILLICIILCLFVVSNIVSFRFGRNASGSTPTNEGNMIRHHVPQTTEGNSMEMVVAGGQITNQ